MAQRATGLMSAAAPKRAGRGSRAASDAPDPLPGIPVDLRRLLQPYKGRGKLTIRVERMPPLTRFSAGRNNGDNSWSLTLDELEDLLYLPGTAFSETHRLAVRIIGHDSAEAFSVAVLDYDISPDGSASVAEAGEEALNVAGLDQLRRLRDELAQMAARLSARDTELSHAKVQAKAAEEDLSRARALWAAEVDAKLAEARKGVEQELAQSIEARKKEQDVRLAQAGDLDSLRKTLQVREGELDAARASVAATEAKAERAIRDSVAKAEKVWKAEEAARLAAAQATWREQSERAIAEARASAKKPAGKDAEQDRQRDAFASLQKNLAVRETELARLRAETAATEAKAERALKDQLSKAEKIWKAEEAERFAAAEAKWRERSEQMLSEVRDSVRKTSGETQAERERQKSELEALRKALAARESELAEARANALAEREKTESAIREAISTAGKIWKAEEAARFAQAEAQWRAQSDSVISEARANARKSEDQGQSDTSRLADALAGARKELAAREAELAETKSSLVQAGLRHERELRDALIRAEENFKQGEAARAAAAQVKWREELERTLADMRAVAQKSEEDGRSHTGRLSGELGDLRKDLAARERELAETKSAMIEAAVRHERELRDALMRAEENFKSEEAARAAAAQAKWREELERKLADMHAAALKSEAEGRSESVRLNDVLQDARKALAAREAEVAALKSVMAEEALRHERERRDALAKAEQDSKAQSAAELEAAESKWREASERALREMREAAGKSAEEARADRERSNEELADLRKRISERDAEVEQLRAALVEAGLRHEREMRDALAAADASSKAAEAARAAASEARWQEKSASAAAEAQALRTRLEAEAQANVASIAARHEAVLQNARDEVAFLQKARETELGQLRGAVQQAQDRIELERQNAQAHAERHWRDRFAEATARYEAAEAALSEMRVRTGANATEETVILRDEIRTLRAVLANREAELAEIRAMDERHDAPVEEAPRPNRNGLILGGLVLACVLMAAFLLWPAAVPYLPYDWQVKIYEMTGGMQDVSDQTANPAPPKPAAPKLETASVARGVNLRKDASVNGAILTTLAPGTSVTVLERKGDWTRVRAPAKDPAKSLEGWVFDSFLKHDAAKSGGH